MKKAALIGVGNWGKNILRELTNLGCDVIVVLHGRDPEKEARLKENYPGASFTYSAENILEDQSIEHVVIATPTPTHYDLARSFLESGKKVFVEKPVTDSARTASLLVGLAEERTAQFMVGHIFLYHPCFIALKGMLKVPEVTGVFITKTSRSTERPHSSKGLFLDSFIHEVSILLKLFGTPAGTSYEKVTIR